jgi:protein-S-isoprenylcysteine O-methyltransferase Ste14
MNSFIIDTPLIGTIFYIAVGLISFIMYNNSNSNYSSDTGKIRSLKSFMYFYKIIQLSTLMACIFSLWSDSPTLFKLFVNNDFLVYMGISISGLSISLFAMARFSLGDNYSPCYDSYLPKDINTTGIYSIVRHPIYSSNILLVLGIFLSSASGIVLFNGTVLTLYYYISAAREENAIVKKFPNYCTYQIKTGMFFPHLVKSFVK